EKRERTPSNRAIGSALGFYPLCKEDRRDRYLHPEVKSISISRASYCHIRIFRCRNRFLILRRLRKEYCRGTHEHWLDLLPHPQTRNPRQTRQLCSDSY